MTETETFLSFCLDKRAKGLYNMDNYLLFNGEYYE